MKTSTYLAITFFSILGIQGFAQDSIPSSKSKLKIKDQVILDLTMTNWLNIPSGIKNNMLQSRCVGVYYMFEIPFGKSNFSVAFGAGFSSQNVSNNAKIIYSNDSTIFEPITASYKANKISTNYLDIPVELRFKTNPDSHNKSFYFTAGFKGEYLVNSHTKYKDSEGKLKVFNVKNLLQYPYGITVRTGYGWFGLVGYYSLTTLFDGKGPAVTPFSVGVTLNPMN